MTEPNSESYPWHETQWTQIETYLDKGRMPHALLFWGAKGLGKQAFVERLAKRLLCLSKDKSACGDCQSCHWLSHEGHPDKILLTPEEGKNIITVDAVRSLFDTLNQTSVGGQGIVVIIRLAEQMNTQAFNALLKLLEEPAQKVYFLLISEQMALLPQTIRSRAQSIYFPLQDGCTIQSYLSEQGLDTDKAFLLKGAPLLNEERLSAHFISERQALHETLLALKKGECCPIQTAEKWEKQDLFVLLEGMGDWMSDAIKVKMLKNEAFINNPDSVTIIKSYVKNIEKDVLLKSLDKINAFRKVLLDKVNINKQLWLEELAIGLRLQE